MKYHQCDLNCLPARFGLDFATAAATAAANDKTAQSRPANDVVPIMLAAPMHGCDSPPSRASDDVSSAASGAYRGALVLAFRGECSFAAKAIAARDGGALGLVVANVDSRSNAAAAATRVLASADTRDEAASAAATAQAASAEAVIAEEQPFFMVANPGEDRGLQAFPVFSVGGMEGRWLRAAVLLSTNSHSADEPGQQPGSETLRMSWRMLPKFSAVDSIVGGPSGLSERSISARTVQTHTEPLSVAALVSALVASRRRADVIHGDSTTENNTSVSLGSHADENERGPDEINKGESHPANAHGRAMRVTDKMPETEEVTKRTPVGGGIYDSIVKDADDHVSTVQGDGSLQLATQFAKMDNPQRAIKELIRVARISAARAKAAAKMVAPGGNSRSMSAPSCAVAYREMRNANAQEAKALLLLAWLQQDICEWDRPIHVEQQEQLQQLQQPAKYRKQAPGLPSVLQRLVSLVVEWGWGGAGASQFGAESKHSKVQEHMRSTAIDDEEDSTGGDDEEDSTGGDDEEDTTGIQSTKRSTNAKDVAAPEGYSLTNLGWLLWRLPSKIVHVLLGKRQNSIADVKHRDDSQSQRLVRERIIAAVGAAVANEATIAASADSAALASLCNQLQPSLASDGDGADFTFGGTNFGAAEAQFAARFKQLRLVQHRLRTYWSGFPGLKGVAAVLRWFLTLGFLRGTPPPKRRRVRVGYISSGFVPSHPLFGLVRRLFSMHERDRFDIWCYAIGNGALYHDQEFTWNSTHNHGRIPCAHVRNFVYDNSTAPYHNAHTVASAHGASNSHGDTLPLSAVTLASQLMIDDIDIVVDLDAYTRGGGKRGAIPVGHGKNSKSKASSATTSGASGFDASSMLYAAYLPGRIRLHWLGQPSRAIGAAFMDYFVSDRTLVPPEAEAAMRAEPLEAARVVTAAATKAGAVAAAAVRRALGTGDNGDTSIATAWEKYGSLPAVRAAIAARRAAAAAEAAAQTVRSMERLMILPCSYYIGEAQSKNEKVTSPAEQLQIFSTRVNETNAICSHGEQESCKSDAKPNGTSTNIKNTSFVPPICRVWAPFHGTRVGITPVGLSGYLAALSQKRDAATRLARLSAVGAVSQMEGVAQRAAHGLPARRAQVSHSRSTRSHLPVAADEDEDETGTTNTQKSARQHHMEVPAMRSSVSGFVFACFAKAKKICPQVMKVWMRLLRRVPGSVLWITSAAGSGASARAARQLLREMATAAGVPEERLIFGRYLSSRAAHLRRLSLADLALDTLAFNAGSGAVDTLRAGVPLLSLAAGPPLHLSGQTSDVIRERSGAPPIPAAGVPATAVAARMGASVLHAALDSSVGGPGRAHLLLAHSLRE
eukprot:g547.t1